jgi:signal transduction histidine kinase/ActR/RegA family two-component response regulator
LKTTSKYLSIGTIFLILLIIVVQIAEGFSGFLLLPLSRFVYFGLTFGSHGESISQVILVSGLVLLLISFIRLAINFNYDSNSLWSLHLIQAAEQSSRIPGNLQAASQSSITTAASKKKSTKKPKSDPEHGIVMISGGVVVFANKKFFQLTGYQPMDVFGKDFASFIRPDTLINYTMLSRMDSTQVRYANGFAFQTINNNSVLVKLSLGEGKIYEPDDVNIFTLTQSEVEAGYDSALAGMFFDSIEHVDTLHWIWDEKGIIYLNSSCRKLIPFDLGKVLLRPGLLLKAVNRAEREHIREAFRQFLVNGKFNEELSCVFPDGSRKFYRVSITSQYESGNYPSRNHAIAYDITEERQSLLKAEEAAREAEIANKNKTDFLANMSHEIRSPLNGIIGFSELLADKNITDSERERYVSIIQNNGNALITLLSDLIDISKLEAGKLLIANRVFKPSRLLEELKYQFCSNFTGKPDQVSVSFSGSSSWIEQEITSDPNRLRQILVNLITNALKFTTKGRIEIGADFLGEDMIFWVKDSGIGIPVENQNAIFERFRQVESPDTKPLLGFGLGLAISKALVELLGGRLWVESIPDQGSLFVFTIKTNIVNNTMETIQINNSNYPYDFKGHTILIAEDIDFSFLYIEAVLRRTGVKILWAQNGREAIEHVKANQSIDLVLMDMQMPVMNGYEASEVIAKLRPGLPVIAQTAFVLPDDIKKCYASGCTGYLAKPIRKEQLLNTLSEYFEKIDHQSEDRPVYKVSIG